MTTDDKIENGTPAGETPQTEAGNAPESPENASESLEEALAQARAEAAQMKDQALRAMAEAENTRKRAQRDREDAQKYGITNFAREMLTVADNLRRALEAIPAETLQADEALKTLYDGVAATERQLESALGKQQIQRIWPEGEKFDSNFHQAMFEVPDSGKPAGTVVQVLQAGYTIHDRLLRPALVGVAKGGPAAANDIAPGGTIDTTA
jgi:molecular chaperone GrpE